MFENFFLELKQIFLLLQQFFSLLPRIILLLFIVVEIATKQKKISAGLLLIFVLQH